jgi:hypothetical protein
MTAAAVALLVTDPIRSHICCCCCLCFSTSFYIFFESLDSVLLKNVYITHVEIKFCLLEVASKVGLMIDSN